MVAKSSPSLATTPAQSTNAVAVPATQSTPAEPLSEQKTLVSAPEPNKSLFEVPAYSGTGEDPRDATYWTNLSKLKFTAEQEYAKGLQEQQHSDTDYNDALQTAIRNRATQQRGLGESAIRSNLGNSGWLDRNEAEDTTAYTQERSHAQLNKTEEDAARAATRQAIVSGYTLEAAAELGEAAARLAQRKTEEAERSEALAALRSEEGGGEESSGERGGPVGYTGTGGYIRPFKPKPKKIALGNARKAR